MSLPPLPLRANPSRDGERSGAQGDGHNAGPTRRTVFRFDVLIARSRYVAAIAVVLAQWCAPVRADDGVGVVQKRFMVLPEYTTIGGQTIRDVRFGYETYGTLNAQGDNAVFVAHFFTGTSHAAGRYRAEDRRVGYWDSIIGPGRAIDTSKYFVISADTLVNVTRNAGAITTGPSSVNPLTGQTYGASFPTLRARDFVRVHRALIDALGVTRLQLVIGASAGAIQSMEWAAAYPELVERVGHVTGPGLAIQEPLARIFDIWMRLPQPRRTESAPKQSANQAAMRTGLFTPVVPFGTGELEDPFAGRFVRTQADRSPAELVPNLINIEGLLKRSGVASALAYDVTALAWSARAYQLYNLEAEVGRIKAKVLFVPAKNDGLFAPAMSHRAAERLRAQGNEVHVVEIDGGNGHHDGVVSIRHAADAIRAFLAL